MRRSFRQNKRIKWSFAVVITLVSLSFLNATYAQMITEQTDKARLGQAQSYNNLKQSEQSLPILKKLYEQYPQNKDVVVEYVRALVNQKDTQGAKDFLKEFVDSYPVKRAGAPTTLRVIESLSSLQMHEQVIQLCRAFLSVDPTHKEIRLWLARVLSWSGSYQESIEVYDQMIADEPDSSILQREKARVLGWMQDYSAALKTYEQAAYTFKDNLAVSREMKAKKNFYRFHNMKAAKDYESWIEREPDNLEALFDLAQVYSRLRQWDKAELLYKKVLELAPTHPLAGVAYERLKVLRDKKSFSGGFEYEETDGGSRQTDKRRYSLFEEVSAPLGERMRLRARHTDHVYNFSGPLAAVQSQAQELGLDFYPTEKVKGRLGYIFNHYTDRVKDSHNARFNFNLKPSDILEFDFAYQREDVIENGTSLTNAIRRNDLRFRLKSVPYRRLELGMDYGHAYYSDDNEKSTIGADVFYHILFAPHQLMFRYRYENYGFDKTSVNYFSPGSFHFNEVGLEWWHFLNKDGLYWGSKDTYYSAGYAVNFDVGNQTGHRIYMKVHKDWSSAFSTEAGWSKKMYEHQTIYSEDLLTASATIYF